MKIGKAAEDLACEYLVRNGHTVVERNWRSGHLEIDIITLDSAGIHFVEVKGRVAPVTADPEENVGYWKQRKLTSAARAYLNSEEKKSLLDQKEVFFDVFSVIFEGGKAEVKYFPQAYIPINT